MDQDFFNDESFRLRESERQTVRAILDSLINSLSAANNQLRGMSVITSSDRVLVARSRVHLLRVLQAVELKANTAVENIHRFACPDASTR
jgi:hypothetical protein